MLKQEAVSTVVVGNRGLLAIFKSGRPNMSGLQYRLRPVKYHREDPAVAEQRQSRRRL
jgi:hypothetical protein